MNFTWGGVFEGADLARNGIENRVDPRRGRVFSFEAAVCCGGRIEPVPSVWINRPGSGDDSELGETGLGRAAAG